MSKSRKDQRKHRKKVAGTAKGLSEHRKRAKRRRHKNKYAKQEGEACTKTLNNSG
jgi:hypothetical protein